MSDAGDARRRLFEVPIYRKSKRDFYDQQIALMAPRIETLKGMGRNEADAWSIASHSVKPFDWQYNDVVGWATIHGYHDMVKMYLWWTKSKSLRRGGVNVLEPLGKLYETLIFEEMSNEDIHRQVRAGLLAALAEGPPTKGRYVDLQCFDAVSPYLDWRAALRGRERRFFGGEPA